MSLLPEEIAVSLNDSIHGRVIQIRQLASALASIGFATLVVHGGRATGKSYTVTSILDNIDTPSAVVRSQECITTRHLLERALSSVNAAIIEKAQVEPERKFDGKCESISTFVVELQRLLEGVERFILVFDGIDRQRESAPTLLPAIARLGELIPNLTTILITTTSNPHLFHHASLPHIYFPPYTRAESLAIVSKSPLSINSSLTSIQINDGAQIEVVDEDSTWLWTRFTTAVWDSLGQSAARDIVRFREACSRLWQPFIQPIKDGHYGPREFSKLMVRNRSLFQSEAALVDSIIPTKTTPSDIRPTKPPSHSHSLPYYPSHLLISSYLASHSPPRNDILLFSKTSLAKRRKRGGGTALTPTNRTPKSQHRKISQKLLGPQPFPLERLLAIFHAIVPNGVRGGGADVLGMVQTLAGLRLLVRAGGGGVGLGEEGGGKWRCNVGWEFVSGVAREVRFDIESYLID
ncbi:hypothetical protein ACLMJK_002207 [Lecanora helva]